MKCCISLKVAERHLDLFGSEEGNSYLSSPQSESFETLFTIGSTMGEIHARTSKHTRLLYEGLLEDVTSSLSAHVPEPNKRKTVILFGNLCGLLARKVAIVSAEVSNIPEKAELLSLALEGQPLSEIKIPRTSAEAFKLLRSKELDAVVKFLLVAKHFDQDRTLLLNIAPPPLSECQLPSYGLPEQLYLLFQKKLAPIARRSRFQIEGTYLGRFQEAILSLSLGQLPSLKELRPSRLQASTVTRNVRLNSAATLRELTLELFAIITPTNLNEDYRSTLQEARELGFSSQPKVTFTSSSFYRDDEFKVSLVDVLGQSSYLVAQHGAGYGTSRWEEIVPEKQASDTYLSWGWRAPGVTPFGQIKPKPSRKVQRKLKEIVVFLRPDRDCFFEESFMQAANRAYLNKIVAFVKALSDADLHVTLRLHKATSENMLNYLNSQLLHFQGVQTNLQSTPLRKVIASRNLCVFTYDSTGMLEFASAGIPFFAFIPDGLDLVLPGFRLNYQYLADSGMLSETPEEAALMVTNWMSSQVATSGIRLAGLKKFSEGMVSYPSMKLLKLRKLLTNERKRMST